MGTLSKLSKYGILDIEEMKRLILRLSAALCLIIPVSTISIFLFLALGTTTEPLGFGYEIIYPSPFIVFGVIAFFSLLWGLCLLGDVISSVRAKLKLFRSLEEGAEIECLIQALGSEDWGVRKEAARALGKIGEPAVGPITQALRVEKAEENLCPNCGNELKDDVVFCPKCGTKIKEVRR